MDPSVNKLWYSRIWVLKYKIFPSDQPFSCKLLTFFSNKRCVECKNKIRTNERKNWKSYKNTEAQPKLTDLYINMCIYWLICFNIKKILIDIGYNLYNRSHFSKWSSIKRQTSGKSSDNEWQRVATNNKDWFKEWQRVTTNYNEWYNEWQRVIMSGTMSDKE